MGMYCTHIIIIVVCSLPQLTIPDTNYMIALLPSAFVIAVVTFAVTVSLGQVFAQQFNYTISSDQVCVCVCMCVCTCGFTPICLLRSS